VDYLGIITPQWRGLCHISYVDGAPRTNQMTTNQAFKLTVITCVVLFVAAMTWAFNNTSDVRYHGVALGGYGYVD